MDFSEPPRLKDIRAEAEAFAAEHVTVEVVEEELRTGDGVSRSLLQAMGAKGWVAPAWPERREAPGSTRSRPPSCWRPSGLWADRRSGRGPPCSAQTPFVPRLSHAASTDSPRCRRRRDTDLPGLHRARRRLRRLCLQDAVRPRW